VDLYEGRKKGRKEECKGKKVSTSKTEKRSRHVEVNFSANFPTKKIK
jgi:hypothetical protein